MSKEPTMEQIIENSIVISLVVIPLLQILAHEKGFGMEFSIIMSIVLGIVIARLLWNDINELLKGKAKYIVGWAIGNFIACCITKDWWTFLLTIGVVILVKGAQYYYNHRYA